LMNLIFRAVLGILLIILYIHNRFNGCVTDLLWLAGGVLKVCGKPFEITAICV